MNACVCVTDSAANCVTLKALTCEGVNAATAVIPESIELPPVLPVFPVPVVEVNWDISAVSPVGCVNT